MDYDFNCILLDSKRLTTKTALLWMELMAGITGLIWILGLMHMIPSITQTFSYLMPVAMLLLLLPATLDKILKQSDSPAKETGKLKLLEICIFCCSLIAIVLLCAVFSHYAAIVWFVPILIVGQYNSRKTTMLLKKQRLALMAHQAKQTFDALQEFPDTYATDCRIKIRYLAKNGIDVDTALKNMEGNIDNYHDFLLSFVGESHRKEDELYTLMAPETLLQYGAKVHALRVKAHTLGLRNLTDTAFFHEMEAFAGNLEVVHANWEKLSFEWDEACDIFTNYIQSLGLKNHAIDSRGNQITFREWGEQLHEAFEALEAYDTTRAKNILNELLQYQIDADITKNLKAIVANIDDILKA